MLHYKCGSRVNDLRKRRLCLKTALNYLPKRTARKCVYDVIDYLKTTTMQGTVSASSSGPSKQASAKSAGSNHHHHHYHHNSYFSNSEQLKLLNCDEKSIHWFIECLCFGVQFTLGDLTDDIATDDDVDRELERMKSSVGVCCEWLSCLSSEQCAGLSSAFSSMTIDQASTAAVAPAQIHHRLTNIPNVFQKNPLKFYDQILWALSQVFLPTRSTALSLVANRRILNWKVLHCKKILRLAEALLQSPAPQLMSDRNEYTNVLMFVLSIADNVLSTKNDLADSLNAYLIMSVFRIWLAACEQCFPLTECWQTFREMLKTWTHHGYVYCQWSQICLAMTVDMYNVCWQMSEFTRHKYEAPYAISDPECLCNAWLRFIQLIDDPGDLIAFERRTCGVFGICGTTGTMAAGSDGTAAKSAAASLSSITTTTSTITTTGTLDLVMKHCCEMLNNLLISDQRKRSSVNMLFKLFGPWLFKISAQSLSEKSQSMAIELICRMVSSIQPDEYIDRKYLAITLSILHSACSSFKFAPAKAVIAFISNSPEMLCSYVPLGFLLAIFALALKCVHVTVTRYMFNAGPKKTNETESQLVLRAVTSFLRIGTGFLFRHKRWVMIPTMDGSASWDRLMADLGEVTCSMMFISSLELNDLHSLCASVNLILTNFTIANGVRPRRRRQKKFSFDFVAWTDQMIRVLVAKLNNQLADNYVCASLCFNLLNVFTFTRSTAHFALIIDCCRRYCILQLEKESYRHVRDMHTAIVDAYECCTRWIVELLNKQGDNRDCVAFEHMDEIISELQKMVEMGLSGHRNQPQPPPAPPPPRPLKSVSSSNSLTTASLVSVSSNHKKPASIRVKKAAEHLLAFGLFRGFDMVDMNDAMHSRFRKVAAVTFMSHPQHVITLSADPDNLRKVGILIRTVFGCCEWKIEYRQKPRNSDRIKTPRILLKESKLMNRRPPKNIPAKYSTKRFEQLSSASSAATFLTLDDLNPIDGLQYIPSSMFEHFREPPIAKVNVGQQPPPKPNFVRIMLAQSTLFTLHIIRNTEQRRRQRRERLNVSRTTTTGLNTDLDTVAFFANLSDENLQSAFEYLDRIPRKIKADCLVLNESSFRPSLNPFDSEVIKVPRIELCDERDSLCGVRILFSAKNSPEFCSSHPLISRPLVSVYWLDDLASPTTNNASSSNNNLFADNNKLSSTNNNEQCPVSVEIWRRNGIIFHIDCVDQEASKYWLSITIVNGILVNETAFPKALSAFIADLYHKHRRSNPLANTRNTAQRTQSGQFASKSGIQFRKLKLIELANRFTENPMNPLTIHKLCLNRRTFHL